MSEGVDHARRLRGMDGSTGTVKEGGGSLRSMYTTAVSEYHEGAYKVMHTIAGGKYSTKLRAGVPWRGSSRGTSESYVSESSVRGAGAKWA